MGSNNFEWKVIIRVVFLLITLSIPAVAIINGWSELLVFWLPVVVYQVYELIKFLKQAQQELNQFIESVHYRDFSRYFNESHTYNQLRSLRKGFNEINATFKTINREKETQFQNLQKVMELVNTGILTYNVESGEVVLMNEPLKKLLHLPYMKTLHYLAKKDEDLYKEVIKLEPGHTKITTAHTSYLEKNSFKLLLSATAFQNDGQHYKLVAFQNVNEALDETESEAWQKLLNVMTHEIMNSVAPISSLANTLKHRLQEITIKGASADDVDDLEVGVETIKRRSEGLLRFAETYRNLSKITKLNLTTVYVQELFSNLQRLMAPTLAQKNIQLDINLKDPAISLKADTNLLDQVLINLLVNAMEAVKDQPDPHITLTAYTDSENKTVIRVIDNGTGMSREVQEKIFIPFFSTKKQGSGIGLSLCKQIMMLHRGSIQVQSEEGEGTAFSLRFV
ncbi:HAMP domain-containing histidine kinase [Pontibacter sp. KCTC 32443]|uniref:sensor histidine kinase n=1 Tax=Pontibacter TaxID=323449 RepID=UPI00164D6A1D|nr:MULTISPECIES: HAMP domain-containing sensor histidine kinase [Pontibacter]MBC5774668.1 HAMP domain-containing histidine kinase [Pontibacter sp. KCTC 32443]